MIPLLLAALLAQAPAVRRSTPASGDPGLVTRQAGPVGVQGVDAGPVRVIQTTTVGVYGADGGAVITDWHITDPLLQVRRTAGFTGTDAGVINVMGKRTQGWSSTSILGDVVQYLGTSQALMNVPSTSTVYYLRSSSSSDTDTAGGNARSVRVTYLDVNGNQFDETVSLDGGVPQPLRHGDAGISFIQYMEVASVGSGGEVAAGDLTISSTSTGAAPAVSTIVEMVAAGGNRSLSGRYKIPTGHMGYMVDWACFGTGNGSFDARIRAQAFASDGTFATPYHFLDTGYVSATVGFDTSLHWAPVPAGAIVKISAIPSSAPAANRLDCSMSILQVKNP